MKTDLREWALSKVIWVADRGFTSEENRRFLMQGGGGYIIGKKLRSGSAEVKAALSRQSRYKIVRDSSAPPSEAGWKASWPESPA